MNPDLEQLYIASYDAKGGFWTEPAIEFLRRANEECVAGRPPERFAIGIHDGMIEALRFVKAIKAMRRARAEKNGTLHQSPQTDTVQGGATFSGGGEG